MAKLTRAEFVARAVADMEANRQRKHQLIRRGRREAALARADHIDQWRKTMNYK